MTDIRKQQRVCCRFCGSYIKFDGAHWQYLYLIMEGEKEGLRTCPKSPTMTKMHAPEEYANVVELA